MAVRRRRAPEPIASTLGSIIDRLDTEGHFAIVRLVQAWPEIVGETIARRTEVVELKFHTAVVRVSGAMWIHELNLKFSPGWRRAWATMRCAICASCREG
jgi:hypothetical protein